MKTFFRLSFAIILVHALSSCNDTGVQSEVDISQNTGSLLFSLSKSSAPSDVFWIVARLEHSEFPTITDSVNVGGTSDTAQLQIKYIQPGTWMLTVGATDSTGVERYQGTTSVVIMKGQKTTANITLDPLFGGLEIIVSWPAIVGNWKTYANNPVLKQTPLSWDAEHFFLVNPEVHKINGVYRMWYTTGYNLSTNGFDQTWIAYATSTDGINWTKHGAVIYPGSFGSWNEKGSVHPAVLYDEGVFKMWFAGNSAAKYGAGIGHATSYDGVTWSVQPQLAIEGSTSKPELRHPEIMKRHGVYYLYYSYGALAANAIEVYLMTSTDGQQWTDRGKILAKRSGVYWETKGVFAPSIIYDMNRYRMYYTGQANSNTGMIGYAESVDGIHWSLRSVEPLMVPSQTGLWQTTWVGYPSVLRDGSTLKMWFGGLSSVPFRWEIGYAEQE